MLDTLSKKHYFRKTEVFFLPAVVVLVGLSAFGLGRLSVMDTTTPRLVIQNSNAAVAAVAGTEQALTAPAQKGKYIASESGTKYYLPACSGAARIKEENKIWFNSIAEAEAAGYEPAANCPGL